MTKAVQRRRGTNAEHSSFTGLEGELSVNTTNDSVHVHDGATAGGFELARADGSNVDNFAVGGDLDVTGNVTIGGNITIGDADTDSININADLTSSLIPNADNTYDLGTASKEWRNLYIDGTANVDSLVADTADINGGTIDGVTIGGSSAAAGTFTTFTSTGIDDNASSTAITINSIQNVTFAGDVAAKSYQVQRSTGSEMLDFAIFADTLGGTPASSDNISIGNDGGGSLLLHTNSTLAVTIDSTQKATFAGNVGIGIAASATKQLHILGDNTNSDAEILVQSDDTANAKAILRMYARDGSNTNKETIISNEAGAITLTTNATERMRISSTGSVGIGTSSPSAPLDVVSNSGSTGVNIRGRSSDNIGSLYFTSNASAATEYGFIQGRSTDLRIQGFNNGLILQPNGGNVGIGTSSPTAKLRVNNPVNTTLVRLGDDAAPTRDLIISSYAVAGYNGAGWDFNANGESAAGTISFSTNATERMRIDSLGRVGIGTSSPTESLHVSGVIKGVNLTTSSDSLYFMDNTNATANGYINYYSYQGGVTQFRNLIISNGKGAAIATFTGSSKALNVVGALSKGSGSFKIDHPLKPDTHHLVHSFVEAPQADLYYRGKVSLVDGAATVNIDEAAGMTEGTFVALCRDVQCFTSNEESWTNVRGSVSGNILTIEAQDSSCTDLISWLVVGERKDPHMYDTDWTDDEGRVIVEPEKTEDDLEKEPSPKGA